MTNLSTNRELFCEHKSKYMKTRKKGKKGGQSSYADTHLLSDKGETCSSSATWSYRQHDLEEKDESISQLLTDPV